MFHFAKGIFSFGFLKSKLGKTKPRSSIRAVLMTAIMPENRYISRAPFVVEAKLT